MSRSLCSVPRSRCTYDEAEFCKVMPKYVDQNVLGQVGRYRDEGYPADAGLYAGGSSPARTTIPRSVS